MGIDAKCVQPTDRNGTVRRRVEAPLDVFVVGVSARRPVTMHARESADRELDTFLLD
jgi:hypothetical protein